MKKEHDFTNAEYGKFYRLMESLEVHVYLDADIRVVLMKKLKETRSEFSLSKMVNVLIEYGIEISEQIALSE